jgi:hypothetical protein
VNGWRLRGQIATARRRGDEAEAALHEALRIAQAIASPTQLWKTHVAIARLHTAGKGADAARQAYRQARDVIDQVMRGLRGPELRASFERASSIREVYDLSAPR